MNWPSAYKAYDHIICDDGFFFIEINSVAKCLLFSWNSLEFLYFDAVKDMVFLITNFFRGYEKLDFLCFHTFETTTLTSK